METHIVTTATEKVNLSQLDEKTMHIFDVYRRTRSIYERTVIAMGRVPRYRVTMATTTAVRIGDGQQRTS